MRMMWLDDKIPKTAMNDGLWFLMAGKLYVCHWRHYVKAMIKSITPGSSSTDSQEQRALIASLSSTVHFTIAKLLFHFITTTYDTWLYAPLICSFLHLILWRPVITTSLSFRCCGLKLLWMSCQAALPANTTLELSSSFFSPRHISQGPCNLQ